MDDDFLFISIPENGNTMIINIMKRDKKIIRNREFILTLIEPKFNIQDIKVELPNSFVISSMLWKTGVNDMGASADDYKGSIVVHLTKDKIQFKAGTVGEVKSKVEYYKSELRGYNIVDTVEGEYNLRYMYEFFKQLPDDMYLQFNMDTKRPLKCSFEISDSKLSVLSDTRPFKFSFFIAPYVSFEQPPSQAEEEGGLEVGVDFASPELDKIQEAIKSQTEKKDDKKEEVKA
jgi:hypothetical protein